MNPHPLAITGMLALCLAIPAAFAAEVPFGHADWKASPTDPVGFAGQGNNWFPGATPPMTWSHTADGKSQNILWKVPHPDWTGAIRLESRLKARPHQQCVEVQGDTHVRSC